MKASVNRTTDGGTGGRVRGVVGEGQNNDSEENQRTTKGQNTYEGQREGHQRHQCEGARQRQRQRVVNVLIDGCDEVCCETRLLILGRELGGGNKKQINHIVLKHHILT